MEVPARTMKLSANSRVSKYRILFYQLQRPKESFSKKFSHVKIFTFRCRHLFKITNLLNVNIVYSCTLIKKYPSSKLSFRKFNFNIRLIDFIIQLLINVFITFTRLSHRASLTLHLLQAHLFFRTPKAIQKIKFRMSNPGLNSDTDFSNALARKILKFIKQFNIKSTENKYF